MTGQITRRQLLAMAIGASVAALAAACGGPSGEAFAPARTPTPPGTAVYVPPTIAGNAPPSNGAVFGTVLPTPRRGAPAPDFVRMLSFVPDDPAMHAGYVTYANPGEIRRLYAYDQIHGPADLQAQNILAADYQNVLSGCALSEFAGTSGAPGKWRDAFGYDSYAVDREVWAGRLPVAASHMEGTFDTDAITARLQMGGYAAVTSRSGIAYLSVRGDNEEDLRDARSQLALGRMNRVAVAGDRLIASPKSAVIQTWLDAEAHKVPALDVNPIFRALAEVFTSVTSITTAPPAALATATANVRPEVLAQFTRGFVPLHAPELYAAGYTDIGTYQRTMHLALVYPNPSDAATDVPEIQRRVNSFRLQSGPQLIPTYASGATVRTVNTSGKGVLIADIALLPDPPLSRFWLDTWQRGEVFLLLSPSLPGMTTGMGTPVMGATAPGTPRPPMPAGMAMGTPTRTP